MASIACARARFADASPSMNSKSTSWPVASNCTRHAKRPRQCSQSVSFQAAARTVADRLTPIGMWMGMTIYLRIVQRADDCVSPRRIVRHQPVAHGKVIPHLDAKLALDGLRILARVQGDESVFFRHRVELLGALGLITAEAVVQ